ncbi:MAG: hypothetical protein IJA52_03095 [Clostridia bacterium]|nr:hypothetical protein [Clostridia bacterium]
MNSINMQFGNAVADIAKKYRPTPDNTVTVDRESVKALPPLERAAAGYVPEESYIVSGKPASISGEVSGARDKYEAWEAKRPAEYRERYAKEIQSLLSSLSGMSFDYDPESDPVFKLSRDEAVRRGRLAMEDAIGKAAALSGGYANSYAASVGQQAFAGELGAINELIPELYEAAYDRYENERDSLSESIKLLSSLEDEEFGRYTDMMKQYFDEGELLFDNYAALSKEEYDRYLDYANLMLKASK